VRNTDFISKETKLFVSLSEMPGNTGTVWFNKMFTQKKIDAIYKAFQVDRNDFKSAFDGVRALKVSGGAISMPFKTQAAQGVDELRGVASVIGAINTFKREESGKISGYNTDYIAACRSLPLKYRSIYMLGTGGVAASIAWAIRDQKSGPLTVISRNRDRNSIPKDVEFEWRSWESQEKLPAPEVLINATSLGMSSTAELTIPEQWWRDLKWVMDLTYRPEGNKLAREVGVRKIEFIDGKKFARWQALEQFKIYTGLEIDEQESDY